MRDRAADDGVLSVFRRGAAIVPQLSVSLPSSRWIPYTDDVVVVGSNPLRPDEDAEKLVKSVKQTSEYKKVAPLRELLKKVCGFLLLDSGQVGGLSTFYSLTHYLVLPPESGRTGFD